MPRIKGWVKSKKYDGNNPQKITLYQNKPQKKELWIVKEGRSDYYSVSITDRNKMKQKTLKSQGLMGNGFNSYSDALKYAINYMRRNPNG